MFKEGVLYFTAKEKVCDLFVFLKTKALAHFKKKELM